MRRLCFRRASLGIALVLLALASRHAQAGSVTFSTAFLNSSGGTLGSQDFNGGHVIFLGTDSVKVTFTDSNGPITDSTPFVHSLGTINADYQGGGGSNPVDTLPFQLQISQTDPTVGSGSFSSTVNGSFGFFGGSYSVTFDQTSLTIGNVTYQLGSYGLNSSPPPLLTFTPYTTDGGKYTTGNNPVIPLVGSLPFTIFAQVNDAPTAAPEPSTLVSAGVAMAMFGLTWTVRRRRKSA